MKQMPFIAALLLAGCVSRTQTPQVASAPRPAPAESSSRPTLDATTQPSELAPPVQFQSKSANMKFAYPSAWHPVKDDTVLTLVPAGEQSIGLHTVAIDEPDLPLHIPGLIPLGAVVDGFVKDLKKRYKDVVVQPVVDHPVDGAKGSIVHALGTRPQGEVIISSLLCVHGDHVYIVDSESDRPGAAAAKAAFDRVVNSIQWME